MKLGKFLPFKRFFKRLKNRGQAIVEFVLLLFAISAITFGFVRYMNRGIGTYWEYYVNLIIDDKPGTKTVRIR